MRSFLFATIFGFIFLGTSYCQSHFIRIDRDSILCENSNENILGIENWDVFQTIDSTVNGERIESCLEYSETTRGLIMSNVKLDAPIFAKNKVDLDLEMRSSSSYSINLSVISDFNKFCDCTFECNLTVCSSVKLYLTTVYNEDTLHYTRIIEDPLVQFGNLDFQNCFSTTKGDEKTKLNYIELTIFNGSFSEEDNIRFSNIYLQENDFVSFENRVVTNDFKTGAAYFVTPEYFTEFFFGNAFADHRGAGFPNFDNKYFYDIAPEDSESKQIINLLITPTNNLLIQDYTYLQGALVNASTNDSIRHTFNLINEGATICLPEIVEVASRGDGSLIYRSGYFDFQSYTSCLLFMEEARLVVDRGATLDYGQHGKGLMALTDKASIQLEPHATLNFNGEIILKNSHQNEMFVDLNPTTKLNFGEGSKISTNEEGVNIKLKVYMNGGVLDISNLEASSLEYLDLIYKDEKAEDYKSFFLYPNPSNNILNISNLTKDEASYFIYDSRGKLMRRINIENSDERSVDTNDWSNGVYIVRSSTGRSEYFIKI